MNYLYHRAPKNMKGEGDILFTLNQLRERHPRAYDEQVEKYIGRMYQLKIRIPAHDCLWSDVIHLTAVHPKKIKSVLTTLDPGYRFWQKWFKINPHSLDAVKTTLKIEKLRVKDCENLIRKATKEEKIERLNKHFKKK